MRLRVKNKWQDKNRERSIEDTAGVIAFNLWKIASANVLNLENEGFQTDTQSQRIDVIEELVAFYVSLVDRLAADREYDEDRRRRLIVAMAMSLAKTVKDNRVDFDGEGDHSRAFVELLNERMSEYAGFAYSDGEPGFQLRRRVGEHVQAVMGEKDNKWVPDQVMDIEIPDALKVFKRVVRGLI
jgi:hypothetical protein